MNEEQNIKCERILSIGYNTITTEEKGKIRRVYCEGLQKRVLRDYPEEIKKRLKWLEFEDREDFWNVGINFVIGCDKCSNGLFGLNEELPEYSICDSCGSWICFDCVTKEVKGHLLCQDCLNKKFVRAI